MSWTYTDFKKWISSGCPQDVADTVHNLDIFNNNFSTLPDCVGQLVNLKVLDLGNNNFSTLPDCVGQLVNLETLYLFHNNFSSLPECVGQLVNLSILNLSYNKLTILPECVGQLVNLEELDLYHNHMTSFPESFGQLVNLEMLDLSNNNFSSLSPILGNLQRLQRFYYADNPVDHIPANVLRIINRTKTVQGVYTDAQSVHNSSIQKSLLDSVNRLLAIPICSREEDVMVQILEDSILTDESKARLVEYSEDASVHTVLNLTFSDMLVVVWNRINTLDSWDEIKKTLNTEILDAECKCFTGKISRIVNCLAGYDDLVVVEIADKEQIGTIIELVRTRLGEGYTIDEHRRICILELLERGYSREVIDEWVDHIE